MKTNHVLWIGVFFLAITAIGWSQEKEKLPPASNSKSKELPQDVERKSPPRGERRTSERDSDQRRDERAEDDRDRRREPEDRDEHHDRERHQEDGRSEREERDRRESENRRHGEEAESRIHHLIEAAENLDRAGFGDEADRFRERAKDMEAEFRRQHREGPHHEIEEIFRKLKHLHEMIEKLQRENAELRERVEALTKRD